ncbi:hypothetical protein COU18_00170 [Candidatus Kaiserbacteria bacterium CG10_big_fil_rev_8_21_14_0_10_51_14]|uniref:Uncharacterized protein n=1 Tax=Candidatus Kaiserbacteria bacterium CG10_big_fil_rev_8_21_14_0_10_51_14 TaxID=1974610 RepID=A0A2H0UCK2_9BACT|nr:MAG: hypothetical protein COU18_00170 [Candidatus Kaiserbacteria bacterium CG10_big_fil_rev_8_21_14_0_10_51_14]
MGLESFDENPISRRDVLKMGTGALATGATLKIPEADAASSPEASLAQPESASALESVTEDEVHSVLQEFLEGKKFNVARKLEDGNGLYLLEVTIPDEGGYIEYSYRRGRPEKNERPDWRIDKTFYDETGMPIHGHSVAQKVGGVWKLTP